MAEWYRRKTWTKIDEEEFFTKLGRARKGSREQYLKIQAIELITTKDDSLIDIAETLLQKFLTDYPDDMFNRSSVLGSLGRIYQHKKNIEKASEYYKQAIAFEETFPRVKTNAYLEYAELVVKNKVITEYEFVGRIINDKIPSLMFPVEKYKAAAILSIIYNYWGKSDLANQFAKLAEQNANAETSGFRYHKYLGLVQKENRWLDKLVKP